MTEGSRLSVIIVSYACRDVLAACLLSLRDALTSDDEVIVVDNDSPDGTPEMVRTSFPDIRLIESRANVGFAAGVNMGVSIATGRLALILNPDTRVSALAIDQLIDRLDGLERDAMIGPTLLNGDGSVQRSAFRFPTPLVLAFEQLSLHTVASRAARVGGSSSRRIEAVDWLKGACLLAPTSLLRTYGPFDERFFMFSEDTDLCFRLNQDGISVLHVPDVALVHLGGMSTRRHQVRMTSLFVESLYRYYQKHHSPRELAAAVLIIRLVAAMKACRAAADWLWRRSTVGPTARLDRREIQTLLKMISVRPPAGPGDD